MVRGYRVGLDKRRGNFRVYFFWILFVVCFRDVGLNWFVYDVVLVLLLFVCKFVKREIFRN